MMHHYAGCDIGSTTGKAVIMEGDTIAATALLPSCVDPEETARLVLREATSKVPALAQGGRVKYLVGTGYGRNEVPFANENISEITCHAVGAHWCDPTIRTIVDVGGQDVKAVGLNGDGTVREFSMNDKCAAGTGRFYEAMSRIFRTDLEEFARLSLQAKRAIPITSQCSVFAETEVISLISGGHRCWRASGGGQEDIQPDPEGGSRARSDHHGRVCEKRGAGSDGEQDASPGRRAAQGGPAADRRAGGGGDGEAQV
ncbi:MAG: acyl-CoA dehydratase activase [Polyangiaceae bacterium]|nr:acyl-CoA dehydratase activase [Polyangiaceae bacterium]